MDDTNENTKQGISIPIRPATVTVTANPMTIVMRTYFSSYHLWAAKHFCTLAKSIEENAEDQPRFDIKHRAYVTNSIFSAVAFLEAVINELFQDVSDGHESYVKSLDADNKLLMADFWQFTEQRNRSAFSILDKYQIALTFLRKHQFSIDSQPYQNSALVVKLRNELTHYKPKSLSRNVKHKLDKQLAGKFQDNKLMNGSGNPWFPDKCLGYGCAEWVV